MTPAGWYPDPDTPGGVRWWDGFMWTSHCEQPAKPAPPMPRGYRVVYRQPSHVFHGVMTVLTCGAWIPVWMYAGVSRYEIKRGR